MRGRLSNPEPPVVQALLRLEFGRGIVFLQPQEAVMLRDELQAIDDPSAVRLATQIDVAATMLLAAPRHAGVRAVRVADDERQVLLDVSRKLEYLPGGSFAKLHHELSIGEEDDRGRRRVSNLGSLRLGGIIVTSLHQPEPDPLDLLLHVRTYRRGRAQSARRHRWRVRRRARGLRPPSTPAPRSLPPPSCRRPGTNPGHSPRRRRRSLDPD